MKQPQPAHLGRNPYYAEAASWSKDVHGAIRSSRNIAWIVAAVACVIAGLEAIALAMVMPLKTVVPYTITVDRQTGYVEAAQGLRPGLLSENASVTQSFLAQYVLAREGFDVQDLQESYRKVALWTGGDARDRYLQSMAKTNPESPVRTNLPSTIVQPVVKSISLLSKNSAIVRFDVQRRDSGAETGERQSYAAIIGFKFSDEPMRTADRLLNPLGFQVTSYRRDSEMIGSTSASQGIRQ